MPQIETQNHQSSQPLTNLAAIRQFFQHNETPVYFISPTFFNLLGLDEWVKNARFIVYTDCFDGHHPNVFSPPRTAHEPFASVADVNNYLLAHAAVADYIRAHGPGKALFLMFDETTEILAEALGLDICLPSAALRHHLDNKLVTTRIAEAAGIECVPNVLACVDSWDSLRHVASDLGPDLVIQCAYGDSGHTTFMISNEDDWKKYADTIIASGEVKIMQRINPRGTAVEACVTRQGTLVAPIMTELIGFGELTPYQGGWCGNEIFAEPFAAHLVTQAREATVAMGEALKNHGYRGYFELDFLLDQDTGTLYLGEMNPRITGASPLTNHAAFAQADMPLILFHLLEWMDVDYTLDLEDIYQRWWLPENIDSWSQLIFKHTTDDVNQLTHTPTSGIWRMDAQGEVRFMHDDIHRYYAENEPDALFLRVASTGDYCYKGMDLGILITRGRLMTDDFQLTEHARDWVTHMRAHFQSCTPELAHNALSASSGMEVRPNIGSAQVATSVTS